MDSISRRRFLASGALAAGTVAFGPGLLREALAAPAVAGAGPYGPLLPPDANSLMLPERFTSRLIAKRLEPPVTGAAPFPIFPDGQATYPTNAGGWILVTNSESLATTEAGTTAIRFAADGTIEAAYPILRGTNANCAGGPTPWGTWLSCEEFDRGQVWECDPAGIMPAQPRPALGLFNHEAVAVDPVGQKLYLTEDEGDGGFYRFVPAAYPSVTDGELQVAIVDSGGRVSWEAVDDPAGIEGGTATKDQVDGMTEFRGGEGIWYARGVLFFTTKGDKKVWAYEPARERIEVVYEYNPDADPEPSLDAVDNVTVSEAGEIFVCEDGGNIEVGLITPGPESTVSPFLRFVGEDHEGAGADRVGRSEVCGAVFDPSGTRLYVTSQRAFPATGPILPPFDDLPAIDDDLDPSDIPDPPAPAGAVYEITGPFRRPAAGSSGSVGAGNPAPAGEQRPGGPLNPGDAAPALSLRVRPRMRRAPVLARGLPVRVRTSEAARVSLAIETPNLLRRRAPDGRGSDRPRTIRLASVSGLALSANRTRFARLRLSRRARARLRRRARALEVRVTATAVDSAGNRSVVTDSVRLGPARRSRGRRRRGRR